MLGTLASHGSERADLASRRAAFRAHASIVGVHCQLQVNTYIAFPGAIPRSYDIVLMRSFVGVQRLRGDTPWPIGRSLHMDTSTDVAVPTRHPLDPEAARRYQGVPVVSTFARGTPPGFRRTRLADGTHLDELEPGAVGRPGSLSFCTGEVLTPAGVVGSQPEDRCLKLNTRCHMPAEAVVADVLLHRSLLGEQPLPGMKLFSELGQADGSVGSPERLVALPICERVDDFGSGLDALLLPEAPTYVGLVEGACGRIGQNPAHLRTFRVRVKHPPVPCSVFLEWKGLLAPAE